ncbi:TRAP transporter substrate-binding protein DctP [Marinobacter alexandrii]|jgi:TRAP-type C4-dicarboxylate transport system substrate-binding protein|uniref:TRAP transporter substrate-binding protein DctP n=1 Tax=Marinobacter alexandrii TaxID=2570351 RepID=UPI001FFE8504|nr:TRAP transporter substrate-binding protein DctP [Marinobacter alexandrii]MCK2151076.1 TRAP transporter substrate-binding protein DctP [Marinobacter alexandrii]
MRITGHWLPFLAILLLSMAGCSESESTSSGKATPETTPPDYPVTWRFALEEIEGSVQHAYAQALKESIEERSDGRILLDIFPYGSLGTSAQLTELAKNGSVQLAFASPGHLADQIPEVGVFTLHYLLSDDGDVNRQLLASPELLAMFETPYASRNLKLLAFVPEGWMTWTANKPLRSPADFQDLRIRTMTSDMAAASYRAYGAQPQQTPFSQVYTDLQLRKIDAQANPVFAIEEMEFYEVQSTLTIARPTQFIASLVTNRDWYLELPEKQQQWLDSSLKEVAEIAWRSQEELNQARLKTMLEGEQLKVVELTEEERAVFAEASQSVRQDYINATGERGTEILKRIGQLVETLENQAPESASETGG